MKISEEMQRKMTCPKNKSRLSRKGDYLVSEEDLKYPIIDDIPVLINDDNSLFTINDFVNRNNTTFDLDKSKLRRFLSRMIPVCSVNVKARNNYARLTSLLPHDAKVLIIGGSKMGKGMEPLYSDQSFEVIGSDVSFGPLTKIILDAHDIPFEDQSFDCVVIQAVLEHVIDPYRCVSECHRILIPNGVLYAETPFMQQVHMKQYDFTRFSFLGHRRLFRHFEEIESGPCVGPGSALAWAYMYFLKSFAVAKMSQKLLTTFARFTSFYLKYFDYYLIDKPGSYDAASGYFFMGRKCENILSDKDLLKCYKGFN